MSPTFDIRWSVQHRESIPLQHQYSLLATLSRIVPEIHNDKRIGIHTIRGIHDGPGRLRLSERSVVAIRAPLELVASLIPLSGKKLDLAGHLLRLGVATLHQIAPSGNLFCPIVTIKGFMDHNQFRGAVIRQLDSIKVRQSITVDVGPRRIVRVKDSTIVGFSVLLAGLDAVESVRIQSEGIGGRRHFGCGIFSPSKSQNLQVRTEIQ